MTDKKPLPVARYTEQSDVKIALVNEFKADEERLLRKLEELRPLNGKQFFIGYDGRYHTDVYEKGAMWAEEATLAADQHWLAIARTHFQEGFMALNRAVFQPQRIKLPEDGE